MPEKQLWCIVSRTHIYTLTHVAAASVLMYSFNCPQLTIIASYLIAINSMIHGEAKCSTSIITGTQISTWRNMKRAYSWLFIIKQTSFISYLFTCEALVVLCVTRYLFQRNNYTRSHEKKYNKNTERRLWVA